MSLESSQRELQICFRPHLNPRFEQKVMNSQNPTSLNRDSFGNPPWESLDKKPFGCGSCRVTQRILYGGRWWLPSSPHNSIVLETKAHLGPNLGLGSASIMPCWMDEIVS
jgi:hypothetical protein